jgi:hypothetical protein
MINEKAIENLLGVSLNKEQMGWLYMMIEDNGGTIVSPAGAGKSYFLAVYALLCLLHPYEKKNVVITAPDYRHAKEISRIIFKVLADKEIHTSMSLGPNDDNYAVNGNTCCCLPIGNGTKIRGLRPNVLLVDNNEHIDKDILDQVLRGFTAVSYNPITNKKHGEVLVMERMVEKWGNL